MDISERGIALIKEFEGLHEKKADGMIHAYLDPVGIPTIGWGCTRGVRMGMKLTERQCEDMLLREIGKFDDAVDKLVKVPITQPMHDALVCFAYNVGDGALERSTLLEELNAGKYEAVPAQFSRWVNAGGRKFSGLVRRRAAEAALYSEGLEAMKPATKIEEAPLEADIVKVEHMPQAVDPAQGKVTEVVAQSWTIRAAVSAILAALVQAWEYVFGVASEASTEVVKLKQTVGPFEALLTTLKANTGLIAVGVILIACGYVVASRIRKHVEMRMG